MSNGPLTIELQSLKAQIAALNQLLEVFENTALEQSDKLYAVIAERKKTEEELQASETKLKTVFNTAGDGILLADVETGKFHDANDTICRMLGYTHEEMMNLGVPDIHPEKELPYVLEQFKSLADEKTRIAMDLSLKRKDGSVFYADINGCPITVEGRTYLMGIFRDITERKIAEAALRQSETLYRSLVNTTDTGYVVIDREGKVIDANKEYVRLSGHGDLDEIRGKSVLEWTADYEKEKNAKAVAQCAREGHIVNFEIDYVDSHGKVTPIEINATVAEKDGRPQILTLCRDISERRRTEDRLREAQEELVRKEKLAILGQLAGSVGHELRNPLGVMNNAVYYLQTVLSGADETVREYLDIIKSEISGAERIVSDLLDAVRTKPPHPQLVSVEALISMSLEKCRVPERISVDVRMEPRWSVRIDPLQMAQVFVNLISNAVDAMPEGGELRVEARLIAECGLRNAEFEVQKSQSEIGNQKSAIEISVADTGSGISPENMGKICQPLFTTKARGIGLGLLVVKNLTEANGGKVSVDSEIGKGTVFTVTLPAEEG